MPAIDPPLSPACNRRTPKIACCKIKAKKIDACTVRIDWCTKGSTPTLKIGTDAAHSVDNIGTEYVTKAGPYVLKSTINGIEKTCSANASVCTNSIRRLRLKLDPSSHVNNTTRTCIQGASIIKRFTEYLIRSHDAVDVIMDFPYSTDCNALITFPIEIDLGAFSQTSGISGEANTGPGGSFLSYDYSASETWNMKYHYNNVFPNGAHVPSYPLPMGYFEMTDYDFSVTYTGWTPYNATATQCGSAANACTSAFGTVVDQKVTLTFISTSRLCQPVTSRPALGLYACGVRRSKSNARVCSTCTLTDEDTSVADDVLYINVFGQTITDIPC